MPYKLWAVSFKIISYAKYICGQIGLPRVEWSHIPHVVVSATQSSRHRLRVKMTD
jgi:hypothetical protein